MGSCIPSEAVLELSHTTAQPSVVALRACVVPGMKQDLVNGATALLKSLEKGDVISRFVLCIIINPLVPTALDNVPLAQ